MAEILLLATDLETKETYDLWMGPEASLESLDITHAWEKETNAPIDPTQKMQDTGLLFGDSLWILQTR